MKKKFDERKLPGLSREINLALLDSAINKPDSTFRNSNPEVMRKLKLIIPSVIVGGILLMIFPSAITYWIFTGAIGAVVGSKMIVEYIGFKNIGKVEEFTAEDIFYADHEDYYRDEVIIGFEDYIIEEEELRPDLKIVNSESGVNDEPFDKKEEVIMSKEEMLNYLNFEIDSYYRVYEIPTSFIDDDDWDIFFNTLHDYFSLRVEAGDVYELISHYYRYSFSKSMISYKSLTTSDMINNLDMLQVNNISKSEIEMLKINISNNIKNTKVIDMKTYKKEKK